ncbi:MAG: alpha/beta fold hydrolase [Candidatus Dormibacteria bacterium]
MTVPTHFLLGAESPIPPRHGLATAALIPSAQVTVLSDCGHIAWLERSGLVRAALDKLVAQLN